MTRPIAWNRIESLLDEFLDLPDEVRGERLRELDRHDPDAARTIRDALDLETDSPGIDHIGALLEAVGGDSEHESTAGALPQPGNIGPWQIIELIASGGMGDVYRARRADGEFEATAALKRLRIHLTSATAHDRFRQERQVLSDLRHPHIANLLDGGVDTQGVPYFVMEYVDGRPITTHCNEAELTVSDRLAVFDQVTEAVAAAHRQLVVHRDLKPPNILVASNGNAKLVDFGIAKLLDHSADATVTATHERMLTPRYAAPEQLTGGEITTATDVYGLGVVLFELLSGCQSTDDAELRRALLVGAEVLDPPRMSAAVARLDPAEAATVAKERGTTVKGLIRTLRGDLDEIVAKALRPDPTDRYPTVSSLAADLARARNSEPVEAHRGSWPYRMRKRWARHRVSVTALTLILLSLTIGMGIALAQARAARTAQRQAAAINRFLTEELLGAADPRVSRGQELTVREIVNRTSRDLDLAVGGEPEVEASIRRTLGEIWTRLGAFDEARAELDAAGKLAAGDPATAAHVSTSVAELLFSEGRFQEARTEISNAVIGLSESEGPHDLDTIQAMVIKGRLIDGDADPIEAEIVLLEATELLDRHHPREGAARASARLELASVLTNQGRRIEALENLRVAFHLQSEALGRNHPDVAQTLEKTAEVLDRLKWHDEAIDTARESHEIVERVYGPVHWRTSRAAYVLAKVLIGADRQEEALDLAESTLRAVLPVFGDDHQETVSQRNILAHLALHRGDTTTATAHYRAALEGAERGLGFSHDMTMMIRRNLSNHMARVGESQESLRLATVVKEYGLEASKEDRPDPMYLAKVSFFLSTADLEQARDFDTALLLADRAVEVSRGRWYYPWVTLSEAHFRRGELDEAIAAERRAVSLPDGLHIAGEERYLIRLYTEKGDLETAEVFLRNHLRRRQAVRASDDPLLGHSRALLGRVLLARERPAEAEHELRIALAQYDLTLDDDHEWRIPVLSDLGAALTTLGEFNEARDTLHRSHDLASRSDRSQPVKELSLVEERIETLEEVDPRSPRLMPPGASAATPGP